MTPERMKMIREAWDTYRYQIMARFLAGEEIVQVALKVRMSSMSLVHKSPGGVLEFEKLDTALLKFTKHVPLFVGKGPYWTVEAEGIEIDAGPMA